MKLKVGGRREKDKERKREKMKMKIEEKNEIGNEMGAIFKCE